MRIMLRHEFVVSFSFNRASASVDAMCVNDVIIMNTLIC